MNTNIDTKSYIEVIEDRDQINEEVRKDIEISDFDGFNLPHVPVFSSK